MFRLVTVEIFSYGVRYTLIIAKMRVVLDYYFYYYNLHNPSLTIAIV